jgi:hypothetical protein
VSVTASTEERDGGQAPGPERALAENLRRLAGPSADGAPPEGLARRIAALGKELPPPDAARAGQEPHSAWYNAPTSGPQGPDRTGGEGVMMPTLQACPQCGAQFDVSSFARGQQFRCGACGHLIVAHDAAPAVTAGRVPGSRAPGGAAAARPAAAASVSSVAAARSPRGPQYQPVQRGQEPARAAAPPRVADAPRGSARERAPAREDRPSSRERPRREASAKKGPPLALIVGGGAVVAVAAVLFFVVGGDKNKDKPGPGVGPVPAISGGGGASAVVKPTEPAGETLATVKAEMKRSPPQKDAQYKAYIERLKRVGKEGEETLKELYEEYIETPAGSENVDARKALGYVKFDYSVPEAITLTKGRPFVAAVEEFRRKRWLQDENDIQLAEEAKKQTEEHGKRLLEDRVYRAGESIWANLLQKPGFKEYNFAVRWAAPHLICYTSKDALSDFELVKITNKAERKQKLKELAEKRAKWEPILDEKEKIYSQLYVEFNKRFKEACGLGDLAAEYGGRPDYKPNVRSFMDGCPAIIWIFDNKDSWTQYHKDQKIDIPSFAAGYFNDETEFVYLYDEGNEGDARIFEIAKNLHEGTHQLHHFFARQLNNWRKTGISQSWIGEGLAEYFGAHKMKRDGTIEFTQLNYSRMREAQEIAKELKAAKLEYPIAEISEMVKWTSYGEATQYAVKRGVQPGLGMSLFIYQQGAMLLYMCMDGLDGKYKKQMGDYFKMVLMQREGQEPFRVAFGIRDEDEWEELQKDFEKFVKDLLVKDLSSYRYEPPKRGSTGR